VNLLFWACEDFFTYNERLEMFLATQLGDTTTGEEITLAFCSTTCRDYICWDQGRVDTVRRDEDSYEFAETCVACGVTVPGTDTEMQVVSASFHPVFHYDEFGNPTIVGYRTREDQEAYLAEW